MKTKSMKTNLRGQFIYFCLTVLITLGISISVQSLLAWSNPTVAPPGGNLSAPINVSDVNQRKVGSLNIGTSTVADYSQLLVVRDDTAGTAKIRITDTGQNPELQLKYSSVDNNHWAIYSNLSDASLRIWGSGASGDTRLTVLQNGNVGIGAITPSASLEVKRTIADSNFVGWIEGTDTANYGLGVNIANTTSAKAIADFKSGNTSRLFVRADGNIGIGTTTPGAKLQINPPVSNEGLRIISASDWSPLNIRNSANTSDIFRVDQTGAIATGSVPWARLTSFPTVCTSGQYVSGVGATLTCSTPTSATEVDGVIGNEVTDATNSTLTRAGSGTTTSPYTLGLNLANANAWTGTQTFSSASTYSALFTGGNVGIGTTTPGAKLQINPSASNEGLRIISASDWSPLNIRNSANTSDIFRVDQTGAIATGSVPWARLTSFPTVCTSGQYVSGVGATLTCSTPSVSPAGSALTSANIWVGNASNLAAAVGMSGDATLSNAGALALANSGVTASTYRSVTVDAKGRVTAGTNPTTLLGYGITDSVQLQGATPGTQQTGHLNISGTGLFGANVGIGTTTPSEKLHIQGGGIKLTSPDGNKSYTISVNNTGEFVIYNNTTATTTATFTDAELKVKKLTTP